MLFADVVLVNNCIELKNSIMGLWGYYADDVDIEEFFKYRRDRLYDIAQSYTSEWYVDTRIESNMESATYEFTK